MMLNLRGIVFDDPNGTEHLKLPTIVFEHSGWPTSEVVTGYNEEFDGTRTFEIGRAY